MGHENELSKCQSNQIKEEKVLLASILNFTLLSYLLVLWRMNDGKKKKKIAGKKSLKPFQWMRQGNRSSSAERWNRKPVITKTVRLHEIPIEGLSRLRVWWSNICYGIFMWYTNRTHFQHFYVHNHNKANWVFSPLLKWGKKYA